ncbi:homocysteine S-methyltransferase family protein [Pantoea cypripedii]|uniref:Homocysteine S-methyltransferase n=1 Tax=Pantoea cypripedii TaxID=55209 RepID=A0A6B9GI05_PANCY|nr:homocysteine S-methyltransferase family protein [Pantoea cypripedii]QGY33156.1 homocysteine S-methyltransferase [Pantoea cypripedii]
MTIKIEILDGGMGRLLEAIGAPFRLPEWSALSLIEAPEYVTEAHQLYAESGASILTTNSYGLVPGMLGQERFDNEAEALANRAGALAREVADQYKNIRVAGSIPPLFESYRPDLYQADQAAAILRPLISGLKPFIDIWLIETQSSIRESLDALKEIRRYSDAPVYISYTLKDEVGRTSPSQLRSGEDIAEMVQHILPTGVAAILFNCSQPEVMSDAIQKTVSAIQQSGHITVRVGVYANAFLPEPPSDTPYAGISQLRPDMDPPHYLAWAQKWLDDGASIIGGCCGIGPEHISFIRQHLGEISPVQSIHLREI